MTIGSGLGVEQPACFTSAAALMAATLVDGTLWLLYDASIGNIVDAGIWPDGPRNGAMGDCGAALVVVGNPADWIYLQPLTAANAKSGPIVTLENGAKFYVIDNATPAP